MDSTCNKIYKNNLLSNIKSRFFLRKIFDYLEKARVLNIIKYNNNFQNKLNKDITDYINNSKIEIQLIPKENKYGYFIRCENYDHIHIYFNDNKEEIKRNYLKENDNATILKIIIDYQIKSFEKLFYYCECIEYIYFKKFCRNNINNMGLMFDGCSSLKELNLSNFNTNNVTNMFCMFCGCSSLKK